MLETSGSRRDWLLVVHLLLEVSPRPPLSPPPPRQLPAVSAQPGVNPCDCHLSPTSYIYLYFTKIIEGKFFNFKFPPYDLVRLWGRGGPSKEGSDVTFQSPWNWTSKMWTISQIFLTVISIWPTKTGWSRWQESARTQLVISQHICGNISISHTPRLHTTPGMSDLPFLSLINPFDVELPRLSDTQQWLQRKN